MAYGFHHLREIIRRLSRTAGFASVAVLTVALGIGANTAIFSVINGVLLKPLPYPKPDELVGMWHTAPGINIPELNQAPSNYFTYREQNRTLADMGLYNNRSASVTGLAQPEQVQTIEVTDGTLPILGVPPLLGRWFERKDDLPGSPKTVMLAYGYWQSKFGGERSVIGRRILVDGDAHEVIGVMPRDFRFLDYKFSLVRPMRLDRNKTFLGNFSYRGLARMKPGITVAQVNADVARMLPMVYAAFSPPPGFGAHIFEQARIGPNVRPFTKDLIGDVGSILWVLMGTVGLVLLIACANVANLMLVRAEARQQELAIRSALGAGWNRIAGELLSESMFLGLLGGAAGVGLAYAAVKLLVALAPAGLPRLGEISIDARTVLFALAISIASGLLFGLIPVFRYAGIRPALGLRQGSRSFSQSRERHRVQNGLVIVQVGLALVLVIGSGLMIRTFRALQRQSPGFTRPEQVQTLRIAIPETEVKEPERVVRLQQAILEKLHHIPGVSDAGMSSSMTMDGRTSNDLIFAKDRTYAESDLPPIRRFKFISPGFFKTVGNPLIAGRDLSWTDIYNLTPVVLVSENFAREYWGNPTAALGQQIRENSKDDWHEIIGVTGNELDDGANKKAPTIVYWPLMMKQFWGDPVHVIRFPMAFALRTPRAGSEQLATEIRQAVWSVDPNLPVADVGTLVGIYRKSMARVSFTMVMLALAGGMALLLGMIGIYGVISYSVTQKTREIGIRTALGASESQVVGMFVCRGLRLSVVGVTLGLAGAVASTRLMTSLLFGVSALDPATYAAVAAAVIAAAVGASYLPSRGAARAVPLDALRAE
ncbi:MAG TPA: ABC transporter permease [Bryobacteraceae bacterium]|nr:ABC transporter permease [Bryobacteraceae bacterium]